MRLKKYAKFGRRNVRRDEVVQLPTVLQDIAKQSGPKEGGQAVMKSNCSPARKMSRKVALPDGGVLAMPDDDLTTAEERIWGFQPTCPPS